MSRYSSAKSTTILKDNSWIKRNDEEDEDIDRDPNYARTILSHRSTENLVGLDSEETTNPVRTSTTSVQALTKRFSKSQDELSTSTLPSSGSTSSYTRSGTYSTLKSDYPKTTTTTTVTKDGTTETTITTSTQNLRSPVISSPTRTFTERVKSSSRGAQYTNYSPTRTTKVTERTVTTNNDAEDKLYDTLIPSSIKADSLDSKTTVFTTETVTVKSSADTEDIKTTTTTRTSSTAEDELYDTLIPKSITSDAHSSVSYSSYSDDLPATRTTTYTISTKPSEDYTSDTKTYTYSRSDSGNEYKTLSSPTAYTTSSYRTSRSDDILTDPVYSKSSIKTVYASSDRTILEKDLCTVCRKPFIGDAKMVLDDMRINCHATCFKCEVCHTTLGHMKAGDSLWVYKRMVHCENCFDNTREKWRR